MMAERLFVGTALDSHWYQHIYSCRSQSVSLFGARIAHSERPGTLLLRSCCLHKVQHSVFTRLDINGPTPSPRTTMSSWQT